MFGIIGILLVIYVLYAANTADKNFQELKKNVEDLQCRLDAAESRISDLLDKLKEDDK